MATTQNDIVVATDAQSAAGALLTGGDGNDLLLADGSQTWTAPLEAMNGSGVSGTVTATLSGTQLQVAVQATGLEPDQIHPILVNGLTDAEGHPLNASLNAVDSDADGFIELGESAKSMGTALLAVTTDQQFPTAGSDGSLSFTATYDLSNLPEGVEASDLFPLDLRAVQIHGLTTTASDGAMTGGEVDGTAGYKLTLPVAGAEFVDSEGAGSGAAILRGDAGNDTLVGDSANDLLLGGAGNDTLAGQAGADQLVGGTGADVFVVGDGNDVVVDFEPGTDKLLFPTSQGITGIQAAATDDGVELTAGDSTVTLMGVDNVPTSAELNGWIV
jgi:Ca2+-binding RTX toxin-like protein